MIPCSRSGHSVASRFAPGVCATPANQARLAAILAASSSARRFTTTTMRWPSTANDDSTHAITIQETARLEPDIIGFRLVLNRLLKRRPDGDSGVAPTVRNGLSRQLPALVPDWCHPSTPCAGCADRRSPVDAGGSRGRSTARGRDRDRRYHYDSERPVACAE